MFQNVEEIAKGSSGDRKIFEDFLLFCIELLVRCALLFSFLT